VKIAATTDEKIVNAAYGVGGAGTAGFLEEAGILDC
jgi:hypothetical protein